MRLELWLFYLALQFLWGNPLIYVSKCWRDYFPEGVPQILAISLVQSPLRADSSSPLVLPPSPSGPTSLLCLLHS